MFVKSLSKSNYAQLLQLAAGLTLHGTFTTVRHTTSKSTGSASCPRGSACHGIRPPSGCLVFQIISSPFSLWLMNFFRRQDGQEAVSQLFFSSHMVSSGASLVFQCNSTLSLLLHPSPYIFHTSYPSHPYDFIQQHNVNSAVRLAHCVGSFALSARWSVFSTCMKVGHQSLSRIQICLRCPTAPPALHSTLLHNINHVCIMDDSENSVSF